MSVEPQTGSVPASWPRHPPTPNIPPVPVSFPASVPPPTYLRAPRTTNPIAYLAVPLSFVSLLCWFVVLTWLFAPVVAAASVLAAVAGFVEARRTGVARVAAWCGLVSVPFTVAITAVGIYGLCTL
ncbi:hypothetical protein AABB02_31860 [Streptomyces rimosus]|uniref:hypothetical protein n=1 Tax=Streptomyces rimosus TaxID=1927 RepID=UPI0031D934A7